ncbi:hypothetical protein ACNSPU_13245 [Bacillus velezensis]
MSQELNTKDVTIEGQFTVQKAKDLANILNAGAVACETDRKILYFSRGAIRTAGFA